MKMFKAINQYERQIPKCTCGSHESIMHESGGVVRIICQTCGREVSVKGSREKAVKAWQEK